MDYNKVTLQGTITELKFSHQTALENYYAATFAVERLSKTIDVLPLTISAKLIKDHNIEIGSQILVSGQLRSYNRIIDKKNRLILTVFVKDIFETDTEATSNNIELVGHICKPPIYRTTPYNKEICDVMLRVNRPNGIADHIPCIVWGTWAQQVREYSVGSRVTISGRVQSREYNKTLEDGTIITRTAYEVSVGTCYKTED